MWQWFLNLFRSNKMIMQLAIMSLVGELFQSKPNLKKPVADLIDEVTTMLKAGQVLESQIPGLLQNKIKMSSLLPPEQALVLVFIDNVSMQISSYLSKQKITLPSEQAAVINEVLGWVSTMAKI